MLATAPSVDPVRLVTANLLSGRALGPRDGDRSSPGAGLAGRSTPDQLRSAMRQLRDDLEPDIVALQEVDCHAERSGGVDQAALASEQLGLPHQRFAAAVIGTPDGSRSSWRAATDADEPAGGANGLASYGVALLSRWPVTDWRVLRLRGAPVSVPIPLPAGQGWLRVADEPRVVLAATVRTPGAEVTVACTHLSFVPGWQMWQLRRAVSWLGDAPGPRLLLGDLNLPGRFAAGVSRWRSLGSAATFPAAAPRLQLDHMLTDEPQLTAASFGSYTMTVSDHRALVAEIGW